MAEIADIIMDGILEQRLDEVSSTQLDTLGRVVRTVEGGVYMYVRAAEAIASQGQVCIVDSGSVDYDTLLLTETLAAEGHPYIGVCSVDATSSAVANNDFFWLSLASGPRVSIGVEVLLNAAADVRLFATATPGSLDDAGTTEIVGVNLNTNQGGSGGVNTSARWSNMQAQTF